MASHRIGARLSGLTPEQLVAFIDEQAPLWSVAAMRVAEEHAARVEQPEWILSEVLLSPDLAPHILAQLPTKEHAAKGTCRAWRRGWKETLKKRERPRLLVIGSHDGQGGTVNSLERYDPSTNVWEEEAVAPMLTARGHVGAAVLDGKLYAMDGKLYAVGGFNHNDHFLTSVERYDPAANAWEPVAPMAEARSRLAVAALDGKLYAVGGYNGDDLSSVERYDPALDAWEAVAPMTEARSDLGVAMLDGKLYAVGGFDGGRLSSVERYDPAANAWEAVAPVAELRDELAVAVLDGKLYAVGGLGGDGGHLSSVERYDPALDVWEAVAPMATARCRHAVAVLDGKLYAMGGYNDENEEDGGIGCLVERYDPALEVWEAVAPMGRARLTPGVTLL